MQLLASIHAYREVIRRTRLGMHRIDLQSVSYLVQHRQKELS
jgi:hypothetical protein